MRSKDETLAYNIRYLRKKLRLSQEDLAKSIGIKRSNIAAYESKNVEPRLRVILEMARFFNISIDDLVSKKIHEGTDFKKFEDKFISESYKSIVLDPTANQELDVFVKKSIKIKKVLEGFKAIYNFKKKRHENDPALNSKVTYDIDDFIQLMDHLLSYNETIIKAFTSVDKRN